jgi:chitinase
MHIQVAVYWGQDASGAQSSLRTYCASSSVDIIPLAFLYTFFGPGNAPLLDLSNICSASGSGAFVGTKLANCAFLESDIKYCQAQGKALTISLGGASSSVGFNSDAQALEFADTVWDMFLGGSGNVRPFGNAILDG